MRIRDHHSSCYERSIESVVIVIMHQVYHKWYHGIIIPPRRSSSSSLELIASYNLLNVWECVSGAVGWRVWARVRMVGHIFGILKFAVFLLTIILSICSRSCLNPPYAIYYPGHDGHDGHGEHGGHDGHEKYQSPHRRTIWANLGFSTVLLSSCP